MNDAFQTVSEFEREILELASTFAALKSTDNLEPIVITSRNVILIVVLLGATDFTAGKMPAATHIHGVRRIVGPDGINSRWLQLIEDFPDRVMMGTDPSCELMRFYGDIVQLMWSKALAAMKPQTLEKVAYKNALRVFGLPECKLPVQLRNH